MTDTPATVDVPSIGTQTGTAVNSAQAAPPVIRSAWVNRSPEDSFRIFTDEIGAWWPLPTHGVLGDRSAGVAFRDGNLVEIAIDGNESLWGEVTAWDPPRRVTVAWHPGRDVDSAGTVEVSFEPDAGGTLVVIEHRGWERFGQDGVARRRSYVGPNAWGYVLDHFADGAEPVPGAADVSALAAAYENFFAEADRGGFGPPTDGGWDAAQVIAHMALNDAAMVRVCQDLVHGNETRFENEVCQDRAVLAAYIEAAGSMEALIGRARTFAQLVMAALTRLSPDQQGTEVPCRLLHDGEVMLERAMPWAAVAVQTQTELHVPAHIEQLQNLRTGSSA